MGKHLPFNRSPVRPHQVRVCPIDFADVFIRGGWAAVRAEFGLHWQTERRCVEEAGGEMLKRKRRAYLAQVRKLRKSVQPRHEKVEPIQETSAAVRAAIEFMRGPKGGAWLITATGTGDFFFGATRLTGAEIVEKAKRKGFTHGVAAHLIAAE
ncbi:MULTISPECIES: hypothetical protein [unclassified Sphingomonas]|uniref:hypothetical protein n=1 Tax=unclassified Sphingomonas TaxID=196159 RepID=UPI0006F4E855|nr:MULTISPECIES: hypothetical protein [unclassified Sphingomonas]KQX18401.1 hypothetical protein ASD17_14665 [Sphingomonas sp. Root1294]KQY72274.1 hypothetical protein ASD39_20310 [Sphingomonas sp. Root50]KRB94455.1 hypothetical protein ASE22_00440 [Sphingomonas sp. Root720]